MIHPEEKDADKGSQKPEATEAQPQANKETNWHPHQQIDEEGNEIGPEDIK
jgi:hypothetical protein